nr:hypothetical protein [Tanacetum cinerariifolium]
PITAVAAALRLTTAAKGKQPARATSPNDPSKVERTVAADDDDQDDAKKYDDGDDDDEEEIAKLDE